MTKASLNGLGVIVTRPLGTGDTLVARLEALGASVLCFPAITIEPLPLAPDATAALRELDTFNLVAFVSPSAVAQFFAIHTRPWPKKLVAASVGAGTTRMLQHYGVAHIIEPETGAGSEALLDVDELADMTNQYVLVIAGAGGRDVLHDTLSERGADVTIARLYRRALPTDGSALFQWLEQNPQSALLVTSVAALDNLKKLASGENAARLTSVQLVVPSQRVVQKAESQGYRNIVQAADASDTALITALARGRRSDHE